MHLDPYVALEFDLCAALDEAVLRRAELSRRRDRLAAVTEDLRAVIATAEASLAQSRRLRAARVLARR